MVLPFEEGIELGAANTGETIGGTENGAGGRVTDNDDTGLIAHRQFEAMVGKAGAKTAAIGADRPRFPNMLTGLSQIDAKAFPSLMRLCRVGRNWLRPAPKGVGKAVGNIAMTVAPKGCQHRNIVRTGNQWVTEFQLKQPCHLFVTWVAEAVGENAARGRVGLSHDEMPMTVRHPGDGAGLLVFDYHRNIRIKTELLPQRPCGSLELLAVHGDLGGDDEVPECV
ncbi:MAG: hypothetical protein GX970_09670 [Phyllobacteriaceae bacterium]|nr:hypothetical protein [Phyllobacteriaceae bacterium]